MAGGSEDEPDRLEGYPHPREAPALIGHAEAKEAVLAGLQAGNLHHAWLVGGPEGIGKATFCYQIARLLLGQARRSQPPARFDTDPSAQPSRLVSQLAHPDLAVLRRTMNPDTRKMRREIAVADARRSLDLFAATAGAAGWRVCIVDSADDLNTSSANALLKVLEEPPPRSIFLIVAHQPQRVLPTIRSRCRKLNLRPLPDQELVQVLDALKAPASPQDIQRALKFAEGSVRRALSRLDPEVIALIEGTRAQLDRLPEMDLKAVLAIAETLTGRGGEGDFAIFIETVENWMSEKIHQNVQAGAGRLAPFAEVWDKMGRTVRETDVLNLDRRPRVLSIFRDLQDSVMRMRMG